MKHSLEDARRAKNALKSRLADVPAVNGIGLTRDGDDYAIRVFLEEPVATGTVPDREEDVPVRVDVVGKISAA